MEKCYPIVYLYWGSITEISSIVQPVKGEGGYTKSWLSLTRGGGGLGVGGMVNTHFIIIMQWEGEKGGASMISWSLSWILICKSKNCQIVYIVTYFRHQKVLSWYFTFEIIIDTKSMLNWTCYLEAQCIYATMLFKNHAIKEGRGLHQKLNFAHREEGAKSAHMLLEQLLTDTSRVWGNKKK